MEFDFNDKWGVDNDAEMLNVSLFGSEKKRKKRQSILFSQMKNQNTSAVIHDSDDEKYTKKGKKKLKERNRKLRKKEANDAEDGSLSGEMNKSQEIILGQKQPKLNEETENPNSTPKKKRQRKRKRENKDDSVVAMEDESDTVKKSKMSFNEAESSAKEYVVKKFKTSETEVNIGRETANGFKDSKKKKKQKKNKKDKKDEGYGEVESKPSDDTNKLVKKIYTDSGTPGRLNGSGSAKQKIRNKKQNPDDSTDKSPPLPTGVYHQKSDNAERTEDMKAKKRKKKKDKQPVQIVAGDRGEEKRKEVQTTVEPVGQKGKSSSSPSQKLKKNILKKMLAKSDHTLPSSKTNTQKNAESETKKLAQKTLKDLGQTAASKTGSQTAPMWGSSSGLALQARGTLNAARFRYLNEQLYTCTGREARGLFQQDREAFQVYHDGYRGQVSKWEVNPLSTIIKQIKDKSQSLVIADLGCGEGLLAQSVPQKVHSFDLLALSPHITACDMAKVPLPSESVDIVVFCLSLMGTNLNDYLTEANRILKPGGLLKVAEVVSRFSGVSPFITGVCAHGFSLLNKRDLSQMFYLMDFRKVKPVKKTAALKNIVLKPCIYKKR